jgi:hypothetical protein
MMKAQKIHTKNNDHLEFTFRKATPDDALCISVLGMQVYLDTLINPMEDCLLGPLNGSRLK